MMRYLTPPPNSIPITWSGGIKSILGAIILIITIIFLTACAQIAPAQLPQRLAEGKNNQLPTLSAPFTITSYSYTNRAFSVNYPKGWRVVSSASFAPPSVVFVSPDERQMILITTEANTTLAYPFTDIPHDQISQQKGAVWVIGLAPIDKWESFRITYESVFTALDS